MLLCDAAESVNGKLYILGGGWSQLLVPDQPASMSLAIKLAVPWDQANDPHRVKAKLITDHGEPVEVPMPEGEPMIVANEVVVETGRPAGLLPGTDLDAPLVFNFRGLGLSAGGYVWELEVDGEVKARAPFRVGPTTRRR